MIISGYQGVGKSSVCDGKSGCVDLESSNFFVNGKRGDDWVNVYINIAVNLSNQGKIVFISSHKAVREELNKRGVEFLCIFPENTPEMKAFWLNRLEERYSAEQSDKNFKALANAKQCYEENIEDLSHEKLTYAIKYSELKLDSTLPFNLYWVLNNGVNLYSDAHKFDGKTVHYHNDKGEEWFGTVKNVLDVFNEKGGRKFLLFCSELYGMLYNDCKYTYVDVSDSRGDSFSPLSKFVCENDIEVVDSEQFDKLLQKWNAL